MYLVVRSFVRSSGCMLVWVRVHVFGYFVVCMYFLFGCFVLFAIKSVCLFDHGKVV